MANINIKISGLDKLKAAFARAPQVVREEVNDGIAQSLAVLERTAKKESPVDTGRLRASHRQQQNRSQMSGELFPTVEYAPYVHERGFTRIWKGNPWLGRTAKIEERSVERIIQRAVNKAIKRIL